MVLELIGSRHLNNEAILFPEFLADSINNQGLFVGQKIETPFDAEVESLKIVVEGPAGAFITHTGRHPLRPLAWIANFFRSRGETLRAGHVITTGSYAGILEVRFRLPSP